MNELNEKTFKTWYDVKKDLFTQEEIAESKLRVALIGELIAARKEKGITQRELEELSGVKQPIIARMESGSTTPNLSTVLKVLAPLGKTLYIGDLQWNRNGADIMATIAHIDEDVKKSVDLFYSESNMWYDGIEDGTRPLVEHDLIEVDYEWSKNREKMYW